VAVYFDRSSVQSGAFPAILAIGYSWFWYLIVRYLLSEVSAVLKPAYANILALGYLGAELKEYVDGKYASAFARELRPTYARYYSAVLISGGGNDAVDWGLCLKSDCSGATAPADCIDAPALSAKLTDLGGRLLTMIGEIHKAFDDGQLRQPDVFIHCYDYSVPNGKGFSSPIFHIKLKGPWLKPALDSANVPADDALRRGVVRILIDGLTQTFAEFDSPADRVHVIRSAGTLDPDTDWANELHPTGPGFRKLVRGPWLESLKQAGFAPP
jgi:hypothetical protein